MRFVRIVVDRFAQKRLSGRWRHFFWLLLLLLIWDVDFLLYFGDPCLAQQWNLMCYVTFVA